MLAKSVIATRQEYHSRSNQPTPIKNPFSYTPQTCHPPRSAPCRLLFRIVDPPPISRACQRGFVASGLWQNKNTYDAPRMSFINLHFLHSRRAAAGLLHLAVQHHPG